MKHIVQYSGGVGSAMAAYLVAQEHPKEDIILLFHDVKNSARGGHDEDIYRFNADVSKFLGIPITEFSDGRSMEDVIKENKCLPGIWMPFCTRLLKLEMGDRFYDHLPYFVYHQNHPDAEELALYPYVPFTLYAGYCKGEERRVNKAKFPTEYPVFDAGLTSDDCIPCWKSTSKKYWRLVWEHYPDRYQMAIEMEEYTGHTHFKDICLKELARKWSEYSSKEGEAKW